ncbi:hypothetical protein FGIG_10431 [Fasciola gigantica]|uniref:Uncharacterized protein n=1 Tax=Fasciola gigantica TaxID=46835 RepID=A0A504YK68_FASGI|nr:hypothetical protein FGIG_10431 [Fasciola gigantica]
MQIHSQVICRTVTLKSTFNGGLPMPEIEGSPGRKKVRFICNAITSGRDDCTFSQIIIHSITWSCKHIPWSSLNRLNKCFALFPSSKCQIIAEAPTVCVYMHCCVRQSLKLNFVCNCLYLLNAFFFRSASLPQLICLFFYVHRIRFHVFTSISSFTDRK